MCLFGDGGDGKSLIALYLSVELTRLGLRVLYADWEFSGEDHRERLERITGPDMPDGICYAHCERPLVDEADRLRRIVGTERIDYLVADSVAFACDGPPEAAEVAARYFRALRRIGVGSLSIAHVRQENGDQKPFGSSFWHNGFRSTTFAKRSNEVCRRRAARRRPVQPEDDDRGAPAADRLPDRVRRRADDGHVRLTSPTSRTWRAGCPSPSGCSRSWPAMGR